MFNPVHLRRRNSVGNEVMYRQFNDEARRVALSIAKLAGSAGSHGKGPQRQPDIGMDLLRCNWRARDVGRVRAIIKSWPGHAPSSSPPATQGLGGTGGKFHRGPLFIWHLDAPYCDTDHRIRTSQPQKKPRLPMSDRG
jgi:hypothetical protein